MTLVLWLCYAWTWLCIGYALGFAAEAFGAWLTRDVRHYTVHISMRYAGALT